MHGLIGSLPGFLRLSQTSQKFVTMIFVTGPSVYHFMNMNRSVHERFSQRLKGGLILAALVFGALVLSGGPRSSNADSEKAVPTIVADPTNQSWDAF